jgi:polar amino acid transport system substrate-binding protein
MTRARPFGLALLITLAAGPVLAAELPAAIKESGTLKLTVNATYAPMEYHDSATNELKGLDIDLGAEIAKRLGVKVVWSDVAFAELIPSLQTGRADFIISGISDRASRRENADFVDYLTTGPQFFTLKESKIAAEADLCGVKIGSVRSTSFPAEMEKWSKEHCEAAGKPAIQYVPGENSIDVRNQLKQGRIDAAVQGSETLPYAQQNEPAKYRVIGAPFAIGYQGIMFRKTDTQLRETVTAVLAGMIKDGSYKAILDRYELGGNAVAEPKLNASPQ